jgi:hypothetical protein
MDECVRLQPRNPMTYKLRADMLQRFGHLANRTALMQDFQTAIDLAEGDVSGRLLRCEGVDPKEQRSFLLAYCYHQLGSLQHRSKELEAAYQSYSKVRDTQVLTDQTDCVAEAQSCTALLCSTPLCCAGC